MRDPWVRRTATGRPASASARGIAEQRRGRCKGLRAAVGISALAVLVGLGEGGKASSDVRPIDPGITSNTIELLSYQAAGYRFELVPDGGSPPAGFERQDFDDSAFASGSAPFGSGGHCPLQPTVQTDWPVNSQLVTRRTIAVPSGARNVRVMISVDNDVLRLLWNGRVIGDLIEHYECPISDEFRVDVPADLVQAGTNLLALQVLDRGNESFLDVRVLAECDGGVAECRTEVTSEHNANRTDSAWEADLPAPGLGGVSAIDASGAMTRARPRRSPLATPPAASAPLKLPAKGLDVSRRTAWSK